MESIEPNIKNIVRLTNRRKTKGGLERARRSAITNEETTSMQEIEIDPPINTSFSNKKLSSMTKLTMKTLDSEVKNAPSSMILSQRDIDPISYSSSYPSLPQLGGLNEQQTKEQNLKTVVRYLSQQKRTRQAVDVLFKHFSEFRFFKQIIQSLSDDLMQQIIFELQLVELDKHEIIFNFNDVGGHMYFVLSGKVSILIPSKPSLAINTAGLDNHVGVAGKSTHLSPRESMLAQAINRASVQQDQSEFKEQQLLQQILVNHEEESTLTPRNPHHSLTNQQGITHSENNNARKDSGMGMKHQSHQQGEQQQQQQQLQLSEEEEFEVFRKEKLTHFKQINFVCEGNSFGEVALEQRIPRTASAATITKCQLATFSYESFQKLLGKIYEKIQQEERGFFRQIPLFKQFPNQGITILFNICEQVSFPTNSIIYKEKDLIEYVYFIKEGEVDITKLYSLEDTPAQPKMKKRIEQQQQIAVQNVLSGSMFGEFECMEPYLNLRNTSQTTTTKSSKQKTKPIFRSTQATCKSNVKLLRVQANQFFLNFMLYCRETDLNFLIAQYNKLSDKISGISTAIQQIKVSDPVPQQMQRFHQLLYSNLKQLKSISHLENRVEHAGFSIDTARQQEQLKQQQQQQSEQQQQQQQQPNHSKSKSALPKIPLFVHPSSETFRNPSTINTNPAFVSEAEQKSKMDILSSIAQSPMFRDISEYTSTNKVQRTALFQVQVEKSSLKRHITSIRRQNEDRIAMIISDPTRYMKQTLAKSAHESFQSTPKSKAEDTTYPLSDSLNYANISQELSTIQYPQKITEVDEDNTIQFRKAIKLKQNQSKEKATLHLSKSILQFDSHRLQNLKADVYHNSFTSPSSSLNLKESTQKHTNRPKQLFVSQSIDKLQSKIPKERTPNSLHETLSLSLSQQQPSSIKPMLKILGANKQCNITPLYKFEIVQKQQQQSQKQQQINQGERIKLFSQVGTPKSQIQLSQSQVKQYEDALEQRLPELRRPRKSQYDSVKNTISSLINVSRLPSSISASPKSQTLQLNQLLVSSQSPSIVPTNGGGAAAAAAAAAGKAAISQFEHSLSTSWLNDSNVQLNKNTVAAPQLVKMEYHIPVNPTIKQKSFSLHKFPFEIESLNCSSQQLRQNNPQRFREITNLKAASLLPQTIQSPKFSYTKSTEKSPMGKNTFHL